uniref:MYND-type domain-containing protein n=1 Tax=Bos mutus grunniens TaxID=30521 RepID=A0A8C0A5Y8_BOSMU
MASAILQSLQGRAQLADEIHKWVVETFGVKHSCVRENCWNCGRKASETCSGCNIARYCGSFCQHKDWERHHRLCGQNLHGQSPHSQSRPCFLEEGLLSPVRRLQRPQSSPGQDLGNHLTLLHTSLCDSHRHQRTLSPRLTSPGNLRARQNSARKAGYVKQCQSLLGHHPEEKWRQADLKPQPVHTLVHFPPVCAWPLAGPDSSIASKLVLLPAKAGTASHFSM